MMNLKTSSGAEPIIVDAHYSVSRQCVYRAWTIPELVSQWFGSQEGPLHSAEIDLRLGGRWCFTEHADGGGSTGFEGEYLKIVPEELLVFTWRKTTTSSGGVGVTTADSQVEISFVEANGGTNMRIVHSSLDPQARANFGIGWAIGTKSLASFLDL